MANPITIFLASTDYTQVIPFKEHAGDTQSQLSIEVITPGTSTAHIRIWDFNNSIVIHDNDSVIVTDASVPGHNMFNGYVSKWRLETYAVFRIWDIDCVDLNSWLDLKIVGAPNGLNFLQDPPGTYTAIDPNAVTQATDSVTVNWLFNNYAPDLPVDTTTFVGTYASSLVPQALRWSTVTLRQALDDLSGLTNNTALRYWIDPDWKFHWTIVASIPVGGTNPARGPLVMLFPIGPSLPAAPIALTDGVADGITTLNYENFSIEYDDTQWADSMYVVGSTGYTFIPPNSELIGGSGWVGSAGGGTGGPVGRQRILTANNSDYQGAKDAIGGQALQNDNQTVVRATADVICNFGGWSPGQAIGLTNTIAGLSNVQYMIQKVTTVFLSGLGDRRVTVEFGTAPYGTLGLRAAAQLGTLGSRNNPRRSSARMAVTASNTTPGAGGVVRITAQCVDPGGNPWPVANVSVLWAVNVYRSTCESITHLVGYTLTPSPSLTNVNGTAWTDLGTDANFTNVTYFVTATGTL